MLRMIAKCACLLIVACSTFPASAAETLWIEAEHLTGIQGFCWPMGDDNRKMRETAGHWGLSGPGWAAEWNQGGESGFLSIACGADDDRAVVTKTIEVPSDGKYYVWVRYGDWREQPERFQIKLEQAGQPAWLGKFGEQAVVEEDNEMKLYWGWAFGWAKQEVTLKKGEAQLSMLSTTKDPQPRQVDVIVLTTDQAYRPLIKERPANDAWQILEGFRGQIPALEPLARSVERRGQAPPANAISPAWKTRTFRDKGFLYLWNVNETTATETWLSDKPDRIKVPFNMVDKEALEEFEKKYAGRDDVPIFSDPRVTPAFHGVGPGIFATDAAGEVAPAGQMFAKWLDQHPDRAWGMMMNYHPGKPIGDKGIAMFQKYRDRYVGSISGESLGYFYPPVDQMAAATANAKTRRELVAAFAPLTLANNAEKYRAIYGRDLDQNPYRDVISCMSVGNIVFGPLCFDWGASTVGYESSTMTSSVLNMRMAFMRGAARQHGGMTATYRSCNFGDSSTIFSNGGSYHTPQNLLDNYYSVFSGAGMTWYKFDIWYQYMCGSSMFYHEQGFDEFWRPGGTTAAGIKEIQLSPKGKLVDRFLRLTAAEPDRGSPYTPMAFLVDYAHGWEPAPYWPNSFKNWHQHQDRFLYSDHEKMLEQWFWTAYYPIGPESEKPITGTNEVYLPAVFGDIFDVVFAYPDVAKWRTIDTYPVVIANGEIELTDAEGQRLAKYVNDGGTLLVAAEHLTGPGVQYLNLPAVAESRQASAYRWRLGSAESAAETSDKTITGPQDELYPSARFRFQPIVAGAEKQRILASSDDDLPICVAVDRGQGRLVYLSIPKGLTITKQAHPIVARLIAHLSRGLMPVEVEGDVQWMLNKTEKGWAVTLLNPAGQSKPQQGITPTDFRENRSVVIKSHLPIKSAHDRLLPDDKLELNGDRVRLTVPAGAVRIIELN